MRHFDRNKSGLRWLLIVNGGRWMPLAPSDLPSFSVALCRCSSVAKMAPLIFIEHGLSMLKALVTWTVNFGWVSVGRSLLSAPVDPLMSPTGNRVLHYLTTQHRRLRIDLTDLEGRKIYAEYANFTVATEADKFRLSIGAYSGNAGNKPWSTRGVLITYHFFFQVIPCLTTITNHGAPKTRTTTHAHLIIAHN